MWRIKSELTCLQIDVLKSQIVLFASYLLPTRGKQIKLLQIQQIILEFYISSKVKLSSPLSPSVMVPLEPQGAL